MPTSDLYQGDQPKIHSSMAPLLFNLFKFYSEPKDTLKAAINEATLSAMSPTKSAIRFKPRLVYTILSFL